MLWPSYDFSKIGPQKIWKTEGPCALEVPQCPRQPQSAPGRTWSWCRVEILLKERHKSTDIVVLATSRVQNFDHVKDSRGRRHVKQFRRVNVRPRFCKHRKSDKTGKKVNNLNSHLLHKFKTDIVHEMQKKTNRNSKTTENEEKPIKLKVNGTSQPAVTYCRYLDNEVTHENCTTKFRSWIISNSFTNCIYQSINQTNYFIVCRT